MTIWYTMLTYRLATADDAEAIAQLHSLSWQQNYRGILTDSFLDGPVLENRRSLWQSRLARPTPNQHVIVAEDGAGICGLACAYANEDPVWGTLLDNLHVHRDWQGKGIGAVLMQTTARWASQQTPEAGLYLWVLVDNTNAQKFYNRMGGVNAEQVSMPNPDGSVSDCFRYVWTDLTNLL
ncbi:GNAT family N-acetyltransferase [Spirosoma gilvum]